MDSIADTASRTDTDPDSRASARPGLASWELTGLRISALLDQDERDAVTRVRRSLTEVERLLRETVGHSDPRIADMAGHLVRAGGKRVRPLLGLLCAQFGDPNRPEVLTASVVCELTHLATLYHDDVMDQASVRRGVVSVNYQWDNQVAVRTGDLLFARAAALASTLGAEAIAIQAETARRLVVGQAEETMGARPGQDPLQHYRQVLSGKTSSLIAGTCRLGALLAGADHYIVEALDQFGEHFGLAFQLADDMLDVLGTSRMSGKTPGTDLREGVKTLPVLRVLAAATDNDRRLVELVSRPIDDDAEVEEALALLRAHPAIDDARNDVRASAVTAQEWLADLPDIAPKHLLNRACEALVDRQA